MAMYADEKLLKGSVIEPYARRKERGADKRAEGIARKAAELAATYARLRLPIPMRLTPKALPEPEPLFIPYQIKRERGSTGRRDTARAATIRGSRIGRPPNQSMADAVREGRKTYQGRSCKFGHPGIRYVSGGNNCVMCQRERNANKSRRTGGHHG